MYPVVSHYIRKKHLEKEFLNGLQKRKIDEKFKYVGKRQANSWFDICNSSEYDHYRESKNLLEENIERFVSFHKADVNVIALGPGDALKEKLVVDGFLEKRQAGLFFIDISREILGTAIENVEDSDILKEVFVADLMNFADIKEISQFIKSQYNATNFFTLLGNTLGNYPQAVILKTIRNAMAPGDKILIDVHAKSDRHIARASSHINGMIGKYNNPMYQEALIASLSEANIEATDGAFDVEFKKDEFFPQMEVVKQYFRFNRSKVINYLGEDIYFAKGERVLVGYSNKYTFESLKNILTSHGLSIIEYVKDETGRYYQILCELA